MPTYKKEWLAAHEDSSSFQEPEGHKNPFFPYESETFYSDPIAVDGFQIPPSLADGISTFSSLSTWHQPRSTDNIIDSSVRAQAKLDRGGYFIGNDIDDPQVGDIRVQFSIVTLDSNHVSVVAKQSGNTLVPYQLESSESIFMLQNGEHSSQDMVPQIPVCEDDTTEPDHGEADESQEDWNLTDDTVADDDDSIAAIWAAKNSKAHAKNNFSIASVVVFCSLCLSIAAVNVTRKMGQQPQGKADHSSPGYEMVQARLSGHYHA